MKLSIIILLLTSLVSCNPKLLHNTITMEPTIPLNSILSVDFEAYTNRSPNRFDIVIYELNVTKEKRVFRIIGLPKETIEVGDGFVKVDGKNIQSPTSTQYFKGTKDANFPKVFNKIILKENEFYVLGNNQASLDSRYTGPVKRFQLMGKVTKVEKPK